MCIRDSKNIINKSKEGVEYNIKKVNDSIGYADSKKKNLLSSRNLIKQNTLYNYNYNMFFTLSLFLIIFIYFLYILCYPYYLFPILLLGIVLYIIILFVYIFHIKRIVHIDTDKKYWTKQNI